MSKTSAAQLKAVERYEKNKKRINLRFENDIYDLVAAESGRRGQTAGGFIRDATIEALKSSGYDTDAITERKPGELTEDEEDDLFCEQLLEQAEKEDDGKTIPLEEAAKRLGISL